MIFRNKKHFFTALLILAVAAIANFAQQNFERQDPDWIKQVAAPRIVYEVPGMTKIKAQKNLTYKRVGSGELKMDIYRPANQKNAKLPAIIYIHGGAVPPNLLTTPKDWGVYISHGQLAAASGFVGVTFNHRFFGWDNFAEPQSDVNDLIAHLRANADAYGIDKDKITIWAFSGGGIFISEAIRNPQPFIRSLIVYYGILDLQPMRNRIPPSVSDDTLKPFSPLAQVNQATKPIAPIFIARAGKEDATVSQAVDNFIQTALTKNLVIDVINHPTGQHGFDVLDNNDRTRQIIRQTIEFIKTHQ